ncbi:MAG: type VI secretion system baseplate subunit TssE [Acetobacteraceae bacterium]|nr:type VI secretion system baseplate subunit TssE [Acetobacteraceae bacterium]
MSDDLSLTGARIRLPVLDRLLDSDPDAPRDPAQTTQMAIETIRHAVRRDLEGLLNARRGRKPLPQGMAELGVSPLGYGIPDPTAGSFTDEDRRQGLAAEVEATIRRFEPRLSAVRVTLSKLPRDTRDPLVDRTLRIKVEAVLRSDPVPEPVSFETVLRPATLDVAVRES